MADKITSEQRSAVMRRVRSKNTKPELAVRSALHRRGLRYRLHRDMPGRPDIVFPGAKVAVFVHGCFWHLHDCPKGQNAPKTRVEFWQSKRQQTRARDERIQRELEGAGWRVLTIWECEPMVAAVNRVADAVLPARRRRASD